MIGIYVRVSTEEQARKGYSISDQVRECRCRIKEGDTVREYIDEGVSGEFLDRHALTQMRKDVREGLVDRIVCLDPDRLSRKLVNQLIITEELEKKAQLVFVNGEYQDTPEGKLFYQMRGAISEFEKAKINERMSRGRREKARQGKVIRDYRIYGYDYEKAADSIVINEYEAGIVRIIFDMFTGRSGKPSGINGIAKYLNDNGVPTKRGAPIWHRQVVRQMLMNRVYIGEFYQNRWDARGILANRYRDEDTQVNVLERPKEEWIQVPCPVILDVETFELAQELIGESRRRWAGKPKNQYLLGGLITCGDCGNTMVGMKAKNWGKDVYIYTDIKNAQGAKFKGCGRKVKVDIFDTYVWNALLDWLKTLPIKAAGDDGVDRPHFEEIEMTRLDRSLEDTKKQRKNIIDFLAGAGGTLGPSAMKDIKDKLDKLGYGEQQMEKRREELYTAASEWNGNEEHGDMAEEAVNYYLYGCLGAMRFQERKDIIRCLVKEIRLYDDKIVITGL